METTVEKSQYDRTLLRHAAGSGRDGVRDPAAMTVSPALLGAGLAHLLHELRSPVHSVQCALWLLDEKMAEAKLEAGAFPEEVYQRLKSEVDRLVSLVGSVSAQLQCLWQVNPCFEAVHLSSFVDEVLDHQAARFVETGTHVQCDFAPSLPPIQANKKQLEIAFVNLFRNAADAMPEGGLLSIKGSRRDQRIHLELSDTGIGIPPDVDIFQPFATSKPGGKGLGLAITRHVLETHGATIAYQSVPGTGTTFCLSFPCSIETEQFSTVRKPVKGVYPEELYGCLCHTPGE